MPDVFGGVRGNDVNKKAALKWFREAFANSTAAPKLTADAHHLADALLQVRHYVLGDYQEACEFPEGTIVEEQWHWGVPPGVSDLWDKTLAKLEAEERV